MKAALRNDELAGTALMGVSATCLGLITTAARVGYDAGGTPFAQVLSRSLLFTAVIGGFLLARRSTLRLGQAGWRAVGWLTVTLSVMSLGYLGSVSLIPVSLAVLIVYTAPLLVGVLGMVAGRGRPAAPDIAAVLVAFTGVALAVGVEIDHLDWRGLALAGCAALGFALTIAFSGVAARDNDPLAMNVWTNLGIAIVTLAIAPVLGSVALPDTTRGMGGLLVACACYIAGLALWFFAQQRASPLRIALASNVEPVVTLAVAAAFLGERLAPVQAAGAALVLGSVGAGAIRAGRAR